MTGRHGWRHDLAVRFVTSVKATNPRSDEARDFPMIESHQRVVVVVADDRFERARN